MEPYRKEQIIPVKASAKTQLSDPEGREESEKDRGEREERKTETERLLVRLIAVGPSEQAGSKCSAFPRGALGGRYFFGPPSVWGHL